MPPRAIRPKDEPGLSEDQDASSEGKASKRRAVSSACIPCRKRKSKCDGAQPSCSTCTAVYRTDCYYDADSDHRRKGALKRDIQSLQQQNDALDVIVASLRTLPEDEAVSLLHNLRSDTKLDQLADILRNNVKLPQSFASETLEADFARQMSPAASSSPFDRNRFIAASRNSSTDESTSISNIPTPIDAPAVWFTAPQDAELVQHLLNLYFCWVHPFYQLFSRDHFLQDMGRGRTEFCSAMLVNALLSLACHYSDRTVARMAGGDSNSAGDHFFADAKRELDQTDKPSLTTVQALGLMSIREASQGRDSNGYQYAGRCLRMALEMGLHLAVIGSGVRPAEAEVRRITFWGVFNLETFVSLFSVRLPGFELTEGSMTSVGFGRFSQLPRAAADIPKPIPSDRTENQTWRPYEESNLAISPSAEQSSRSMLFTEHLSRLSELASDMINTFYAPRERFTTRGLANAYAMFQEWHQNLPDAFRLENTALPHVLVLHMYYYACVLHLFRPYIKLDLHGANLFPRDTCTTCANEISNLVSALRGMYGLRRVCPAVPSLLLSATTIHLLNLPAEPAASNLSQGVRDLQTMSTNHRFAAECVDIILSLAAKWSLNLPEDVGATAAFRPNVPRAWHSPTSSPFWAVSIPRKMSSGGARSNNSSGQNNDSPFAPPSQSQNAGFASHYNPQANTVDPIQAPNPFWTPFPGQTMPIAPQQMVPSMEYQNVPDAQQHWNMFGTSMNDSSSQMGSQGRSHGGSEMMNESQFQQNWNWQ